MLRSLAWVVLGAHALALLTGCLSQLEPHDRKSPPPPTKIFSNGAGGSAGSNASRDDAVSAPPPTTDSSTAGASSAAGSADTAADASEPSGADASVVSDASDAGGEMAAAADGGGRSDPSPGRFTSLAVDPSTPLTPNLAETPDTAPPSGWDWYPIDGTYCRDGSGSGLYVRNTGSDKLLIYFEGGGVCTTAGFCRYNAPNLDRVLTGDGESVLDTVLGVGAGRQQPGAYSDGELAGIFSTDDDTNPFAGWSMVYIPYCTGDLHFGSNAAARLADVAEPQQFVGHDNTREFMRHVVPTFQDDVKRVVVTGASAGSFGAALNYSMIADSFGPSIQVDAVLDSGVVFDDAHLPACLQKSWRDLWKFDDSLPPDCPTCFDADGGGLIGLTDFLFDKHPSAHFAVISSVHDEVVRLVFAPGEYDCEYVETADPVELTVGQILGGSLFPEDDYEAGLMSLRTSYEKTDRLSSYYVGGSRDTLHQHIFRSRFYDRIAGGESIAEFLTSFLSGTMAQVGP